MLDDKCSDADLAIADAPRFAITELRHALDLSKRHQLPILSQIEHQPLEHTSTHRLSWTHFSCLPRHGAHLELQALILHACDQRAGTRCDARHNPHKWLLPCNQNLKEIRFQ